MSDGRMFFNFAEEGSEAFARQASLPEAQAPLLSLRRAQATRVNESYYKDDS